MTTEEKNFLDSLLPKHPMGELGMLAEAIKYSEEHREEWIRECEEIDHKRHIQFQQDWN